MVHERDSWVLWWNFESGRKPGRPVPDVYLLGAICPFR